MSPKEIADMVSTSRFSTRISHCGYIEGFIRERTAKDPFIINFNEGVTEEQRLETMQEILEAINSSDPNLTIENNFIVNNPALQKKYKDRLVNVDMPVSLSALVRSYSPGLFPIVDGRPPSRCFSPSPSSRSGTPSPTPMIRI